MHSLANRLCLRNSALSLYYCRLASSSAVKAQQNDGSSAGGKTREKRNALFSREKERQLQYIGRVEKIEVEIIGKSAETDDCEKKLCTLAMNKDLSTPFNCALHINDHVARHAALALVDDKPWDMHRPLNSSCRLKFLYFTDVNASAVNHAYWRSCSFILGYILETSFKDGHNVVLHSWPMCSVRSGSFVYDVKLDDALLEWKPTTDEFRTLSRSPMARLRELKAPFEPLNVDVAVAEEMFKENPFKLQQLQSIAESSPIKGQIPLYRVCDHVDISRGPMINNTSQFGYFNVCSFHPLETKDFGRLCRVQGTSVPFTQRVNSWTWEIVCNAAKKLNQLPLPSVERYLTMRNNNSSLAKASGN